MSDTVLAHKLLKESIELNNKSKYEEALIKLDSALLIYQYTLGDSSKEISDVLYQRGFISLKKVNYANALNDFKESCRIREKLLGQMNRDIAFSYNAMGIVYYEKGEFINALYYFEKAKQIRIQLLGETHPDVADSFNNIANCYADKGETDKALTYFEQALNIQTASKGLYDLKRTLFLKNIGRCYFDKGDYDKALGFHQEALKIRINLLGINHSDVGISYYNIGNCYEFKHDLHKALNYYTEALHIFLKTNGEFDTNTAMAYGNIGNAYLFLKDYESAIYYQKKALAIRIKIFGEIHNNVATNLAAIGLTYYEKENFEESITYYKKSKFVTAKIFGEGSADEANAYYGLGIVSMKKKDYRIALLYFDTFYTIISKLWGKGNPSIAQMITFKGECYLGLKDFDNALLMFEQSLICNAYTSNTELSTIRSLPYLIITLSKIGELYNNSSYSKNNKNQSLYYYKKAIDAIRFLDSHLTTERGRNSVKNQYYPIYEGLISVNLSFKNLNTLKDIFEYMEQSKAGNLLTQIKEADALRFAGIPDILLQNEYDLRIKITGHEKQKQDKINEGKRETDSVVLVLSSKIFDLRQQYEALKGQFERDYPQYYRLKYDLNTVSVADVQQKLLASDQTLVSYFVGDSSIFTFVINKNSYSVQEIKKDSLESLVKQLRFTMYDNQGAAGTAYVENAKNYTEIAYKLYEKLILPIKNELQTNVIIVPDGVLGYIPFEALLVEKPETNFEYFQLHHYLLKDYNISYNYSATLWQEMKNRRNVGFEILGNSRSLPKSDIPNPKYTEGGLISFAPTFGSDTTKIILNINTDLLATRSDPLKRLYHNIAEVQAIQKIMGGKMYTGKFATKETFLAEAAKYRVIHLATHGKADDCAGDYAFLAFQETKDSSDNGRLYVKDLYNCTLNTDLVVLSACETGIGKWQRGEGIISLARAFAYAGTKSIVTTLWSIDDAGTKTLMASFYKNLKRGQTKDTALRQAKLEYLNKNLSENAAPFHWAAFIAVGDMQAIGK